MSQSFFLNLLNCSIQCSLAANGIIAFEELGIFAEVRSIEPCVMFLNNFPILLDTDSIRFTRKHFDFILSNVLLYMFSDLCKTGFF